jgi:hypothetical protein
MVNSFVGVEEVSATVGLFGAAGEESGRVQLVAKLIATINTKKEA